MKKFVKKLKKQRGFTLIEMLIVVAIIAVLVAVSIPVVNNSLEKAREATDMANERAAKAAFMVGYISGEITNLNSTYNYDAVTGKLVESDDQYALNITQVNGEYYGKCKIHKGYGIKILIKRVAGTNEIEQIQIRWTKGSATNTSDVSHLNE